MLRKTWNRKSIIRLLEQMEMYISSGLPLLKVVESLDARSDKKRGLSLLRLRHAIESGQSLSMAIHEEIRPPPVVTGLIACGELSGSLGKALSSARILIEREDELIGRSLSALMYPFVIGLATLLLTIGLMRGVVPQIVPLLTSLNGTLPLLTRIVMSLSNYLVNYSFYMLVGIVMITATFVFAYRKLLRFRDIVGLILLKIPILGSTLRKFSLAMFFRSFGSLVESGVQLNTAYKKTLDVITIRAIRKVFESRYERLGSGARLSDILENRVPKYVLPLICSGEMSGNLGISLIRVADILDRELDYAMKRMTALIEPIMMIVMGGIVGSIAVSIMLPIYDISKTLQH